MCQLQITFFRICYKNTVGDYLPIYSGKSRGFQGAKPLHEAFTKIEITWNNDVNLRFLSFLNIFPNRIVEHVNES